MLRAILPVMSQDTRSFLVSWATRCRAEQSKLREQLAPLESGSMHIGQRKPGSAWEDITAQRIKEIRGEIASLEAAIGIVLSQIDRMTTRDAEG